MIVCFKSNIKANSNIAFLISYDIKHFFKYVSF